MHRPDTTKLEQLLRYLWDNSATDLHLCAGSPPRVRVDGKLLAIPGAAPITDEFLHAAIGGLISEQQIAKVLSALG